MSAPTRVGGRLVAAFRGPVDCMQATGAFTLRGTTLTGEVLSLSLGCPAPKDLPAHLDSPRLEHLPDTRHLLSAGGREWLLTPRAVHLHQALPALYTVIPPRKPPWKRRLAWWLLVTLAARPVGLALLRRLA
jgi:hypothetical protein